MLGVEIEFSYRPELKSERHQVHAGVHIYYGFMHGSISVLHNILLQPLFSEKESHNKVLVLDAS